MDKPRQTEPYAIRYTRPYDLAALPGIERAAAAQFRTTPYAALADDDPVSAEVDLAHEYVWVAVDHDDHPIGVAIVHLLDESVHLHELDVHPHYARQGLGRRLIATVADWARARGATALSLALQTVRQAEADAGLPIAHRICMQLDLSAGTELPAR